MKKLNLNPGWLVIFAVLLWSLDGILRRSLFSGALGTIFYTAALGQINFIQFSVVVLLQQLQPIWANGTAAIILKEKLPAKFLMWAIVGIAASYVVTFPNLIVNLE